MSRRFEQKRRGEISKRKRPTVYIAAEGHNRTERYYFKGLISKYKGFSIRMVPDSSTDPVRMAESLGDYMNEFGFSAEDGDLAFCLIDHDCNFEKDSQISQAKQIARENGFSIIVSNPCFELWFLCHFVYPRKYSSSKEVVRDLENYIPGYEKSDMNIFDRTETHLKDAIEIAKKLETNCISAGYPIHRHDFTPSTEVFKMIEKLLEVNSQMSN